MAQPRPRGLLAADGGGRGSSRPRVRDAPAERRPPPLPRASRPSSAALLSALAGRARHGAASPPMALRRSMGRPGLRPLLLAGLASLLLPGSAAAGRGARKAAGSGGLLSGMAEGLSPGTAAGETRAWAGQRLGSVAGAGRPRLGRSGCWLPDLQPRPPPPTFSRPGLAGCKGREWGV